MNDEGTMTIVFDASTAAATRAPLLLVWRAVDLDRPRVRQLVSGRYRRRPYRRRAPVGARELDPVVREVLAAGRRPDNFAEGPPPRFQRRARASRVSVPA